MTLSKTFVLSLALNLALPWTLLAGRSIDAQDIGGGSFVNKKNSLKPRTFDKNELTAAAEETQAMLDGLARETRVLGPEVKERLYNSLREEFKLKGALSDARKVLTLAEDVIAIQQAIKASQAKLLLLQGAEADLEEQHLLVKQDELVSSVQELHEALMGQHKDLKEREMLDYRTWIMVSEGQLRQQREAKEAAQATPVAVATAVINPTPAVKPAKRRRARAASKQPKPAAITSTAKTSKP